MPKKPSRRTAPRRVVLPGGWPGVVEHFTDALQSLFAQLVATVTVYVVSTWS